jgi:hypothetical protein
MNLRQTWKGGGRAAGSRQPRGGGAFQKHETETEEHVARLEKAFEEIYEAPRGKTCDAIMGIIEECLGVAMKDSISFMSRPRKVMSEWVVHCEVDQRHIRHSQPTREAALKYACSQLLQGHAVNRIVGPSKTITAQGVRDWCVKHRASPTTQSPNFDIPNL